jgi:sec-independent protein translocase protein TatB
MMHMAGRWMGKARAMANEFRKSFDEMARQGELDELRAEIESLRRNNPIADINRELNRPIIPDDMQSRAVQTESAPLVGPEPRAGEFDITDKPAHVTLDRDHEPPPP